MEDVQETIDRLQTNNFTISELEYCLNSSMILVKTNAIIAILKGHITEISILNKLNIISKNLQFEPRVVGEWTVGHYALAVLYLLDNEESIKMYENNILELGEEEIKSVEKLIVQILYMVN